MTEESRQQWLGFIRLNKKPHKCPNPRFISTKKKKCTVMNLIHCSTVSGFNLEADHHKHTRAAF